MLNSNKYIFVLQVLGQQIRIPIFSAPNKIPRQIYSVQVQGLRHLVKQTNLVLILVQHLEPICLDNRNRMHNNLLRLVRLIPPQILIFLVQPRVSCITMSITVFIPKLITLNIANFVLSVQVL